MVVLKNGIEGEKNGEGGGACWRTLAFMNEWLYAPEEKKKSKSFKKNEKISEKKKISKSHLNTGEQKRETRPYSVFLRLLKSMQR